MKFWKSFHPYAMVTILFWSLAYVLTRLALRHFSAMSLGFLRYAVASVLLLVLCVVRRTPVPRGRDLPWFVASGATGFFLYMIAFNIGTSYVTAATSSVIIATVPVMTALLASFFFRERLASHQWVAIGVECLGILLLTVYGSTLSLNAGVWWLLLAAVVLSLYNLLQRRLTRTYPALQSTAYSIFIGTLLLSVFAPASIGEAADAAPMQLVYVVLLGVFSSAVAFIAWAKALELAERTSQVSNYMFFTPFLTGVLGFLLAGEVPEPATWLGGICIILGALLFNRKNLRSAQSPA